MAGAAIGSTEVAGRDELTLGITCTNGHTFQIPFPVLTDESIAEARKHGRVTVTVPFDTKCPNVVKKSKARRPLTFRFSPH